MGNVFMFFDFLSIPQLPFRADQPPRTPELQSRFNEALSCMHMMYMLSLGTPGGPAL